MGHEPAAVAITSTAVGVFRAQRATPSIALAALVLGGVWALASGGARAEALEKPHLVVEQARLDLNNCHSVSTSTAADGTPLAFADCGGLHIIDLSDPKDPVVRSTLGNTGNVEVYDGILYSGVGIYDVRDPDAPEEIGDVQLPGPPHNIAFDPWLGHMYVAITGQTAQVLAMADVEPGDRGRTFSPDFTMPGGYHDVQVVSGLVYPSAFNVYRYIFEGPSEYVYATHDGGAGPGFLHTVTGSADGRFIIAANEGAEVVPTSFDASRWMRDGVPVYGSDGDPNNCTNVDLCLAQSGITLHEMITSGGTPYESVERDRFFVPDDVAGSAHKLDVVGDYVYVAFYQAGLQVLKIDRASAKWRKQAQFDTSQADAFDDITGAWDVSAQLGPDRVVVVDNDTGVRVLQHITDERLAAYLQVL